MKAQKFDQNKYIQEYQKKHYSIFKVSLKKEEKEELDDLLKVANLNQAQFLRNAILDLKNKISKGEK